MKRALLIFAGVLAAAALVVGAVALIQHRRQQISGQQPPRQAVVLVESAQLHRGRLAVIEHYTGTVEPKQPVALAARIRGRIRSISRIEGEHFSEGQVLIRIEDGEFRREAEAMQAEIERAESERWFRKQDLERKKRLFENRAIAGHALDQSESAFAQADRTVESLRRKLDRIRTRLDYTIIRAPFSGVVTDRVMEPGDMAAPSAPILHLEDPAAGYKVRLRVPTRLLSSVGEGTEARLIHGGLSVPATVSRVLPTVGATTGLAVLEIEVARRPFRLPTGSFLDVELIVGRPEGFVVPSRALLWKKSVHLFVLDDEDSVEPVQVRVLGSDGVEAVVDGPLKEGNRVVVANEATLLRLSAGTPVQVQKGGA